MTRCQSADLGNIVYGTWTSLGSCQTNCTDAGTYAYAVVQGNFDPARKYSHSYSKQAMSAGAVMKPQHLPSEYPHRNATQHVLVILLSIVVTQLALSSDTWH